MDKSNLPFMRETAAKLPAATQSLCIENLEYVLSELRIVVRFNMMIGEVQYFSDFGPDDSPATQSHLRLCVQDACVKLDMTNLTRFDELSETLAMTDAFHPMEEWLQDAGAWDGVDRIRALADTVTTDTRLWPVYLENWLVQVVEGVCGWRAVSTSSLPYVLVLVGGQGVGKTHWLRALGSGWLKDEAELHLSAAGSKDHQLAVLRHPMAELAELDGIFRKSDISHMKSFISRGTDEIRAPYARRAMPRPRMTAFCGSVNAAEFLNDPSGSRRFWPVSVDAIAREFEMDWAQLWAQAYEYWQEAPDFHLTEEEESERGVVSVAQHTLITGEVETLAAFWDAHKDRADLYQPMNRTEILKMLGFRNPSNKTASDIGEWLGANIGRHKTIEGKQRAWMFPFSVFGADSNEWPRNTQIKGVE